MSGSVVGCEKREGERGKPMNVHPLSGEQIAHIPELCSIIESRGIDPAQVLILEMEIQIPDYSKVKRKDWFEKPVPTYSIFTVTLKSLEKKSFRVSESFSMTYQP